MSIPITQIIPLGPLNPITPIETSISSGDRTQKVGQDFSEFLKDAFRQVDAMQKNADAASLQLASGQVEDLSSVMLALEKANLSLSLTVVTRDKVLDAYNKIMHMQI
jgi:flagellar hook-basal body complex protein FliE